MLNKVILIGRLVRDVEVKFTNSGTAVANFTIAADRKFSKEKDTDFINCIAWKGLAENMHKFTSKGSLVGVDGRLQVRSYENQDGRTVWVTEVVADDVRFLDSRKSSEQPSTGQTEPFDDSNLPF
jgi:single-strand DNA-binding protein